MQQENVINLVLASDASYAIHVETLLKSLCCYNRNVHIYLFHRNSYPLEWFDMLNHYLSAFNSKIMNVQVNVDKLESYKNQNHIKSPAYYRFLMANLPVERALYLDSDIVITASLSDLFQMDLQGKILGAVCDSGLLMSEWVHPFGLHHFPYFNSGVLLADLNGWHNENIEQKLINLADNVADKVPFGDQCVLNMVFQGKWLALSEHFNYQAGVHQLPHLKSLAKPPIYNPPLIVHFTTEHKPWIVSRLLNIQSNEFDYRWLYWRYRSLNWSDVMSIARGITLLPNA